LVIAAILATTEHRPKVVIFLLFFVFALWKGITLLTEDIAAIFAREASKAAKSSFRLP